MGTKTITILDEAYEALAREKRKGESFSKTILKLTARRGRLADSFGKWDMTESEWKKIDKELKRAWKGFGKK
ncbi:MAG: hypothetical protein HYW26_04215 [Candidatus Aenigmarchaeota archaeon]|nr:hypothetical protein [Candidatus Aenigmarchaeota archaeon]